MKRFDGKVALITGGGEGIGAASARRLAAEGAKIVVMGRRRQPIDAVAEETGGMAFSGNVANEDDVRAAVAATVERFGALDVLVANAGVARPGSALDIDIDVFRQSMAINVEGALLAAKYAIPHMQQRGGGSIVLVSSQAAFVAYPDLVSYMASKSAMLGLCRSIAIDYGPDRIRCNVLCPAWVRTAMTEATFGELAASKGLSLEETFARAMKPTPLRRMSTPEEMAGPVAFLASDDASFITGTALTADGGGAIIDPSMPAIANI